MTGMMHWPDVNAVQDSTGDTSYLEDIFVHPCGHLLQIRHIVAESPNCITAEGWHLAESTNRSVSASTRKP